MELYSLSNCIVPIQIIKTLFLKQINVECAFDVIPMYILINDDDVNLFPKWYIRIYYFTLTVQRNKVNIVLRSCVNCE